MENKIMPVHHEAKANMNTQPSQALIDAAPELLANLKNALLILDIISQNPKEARKYAYEACKYAMEARAAVSRAEGR